MECPHCGKSIVNNNKNPEVGEVISYLNAEVGSRFSSSSKSSTKYIMSRIREGYTVEDLKSVVDKKNAQWAGTAMEKFLRPETLFCETKFQSYINEKGSNGKENKLTRSHNKIDYTDGTF